MKTTVLVGFKGGTARTSTCLHLGSALAKFHDKKVLLIDFDSQANLSTGLGFGTDCMETMVPVLQGKAKIEEMIQPTKTDGLFIVCANTYLDQVESTAPLVSDPYAHERLRKAIKPLDFDYCFIDIPPSLGWLAQSAFYAADNSLICTIPEPYSVLALNRLAKYHEAINENHHLEVLGVLLSMWDERHATNDAFLEGIESVFPGKTLKTRVRRDMSVNRAILEGCPVFDSQPRSRVAEDYKALAEEFVQRSDNLSRMEELTEVGS